MQAKDNIGIEDYYPKLSALGESTFYTITY